MRIYFFGVQSSNNAGHFFYKEGFLQSYHGSWDESDTEMERKFRASGSYDGGFCPDNKQLQGEAKLHHINGMTFLSFWDRSGDKRWGSNSTFIVDREKQFDEVLERAKEAFPSLFERFGFEITEFAQGS